MAGPAFVAGVMITGAMAAATVLTLSACGLWLDMRK